MSGLPGGGRSRIDVLIGTGLVLAALISVALLGGIDFGRSHLMNQNLSAPRLAAPNPPEWMETGPHRPR
ncbi:MAG TPA: hypothetical protein VGF50_12340 [Caulobacteraceae bacterium]|jgi:hypothetical protein